MRVAKNIKRKMMAKDIKQYPHQTPRNVGKEQGIEDVIIIIVEGRAPIFMVFTITMSIVVQGHEKLGKMLVVADLIY